MKVLDQATSPRSDNGAQLRQLASRVQLLECQLAEAKLADAVVSVATLRLRKQAQLESDIEVIVQCEATVLPRMWVDFGVDEASVNALLQALSADAREDKN